MKHCLLGIVEDLRHLDLAKRGALDAGLDLAERLHDGRHRLLKAVLLVVPQVQLTTHHDDRRLQLDAPELREPVGAEPVERGEPVAGVGEHHRVRRLALGDQLRLLLGAGGGVDDGDGDAVGEVVGGEAGVGHDLGDVLGELLGGDGDDEAGLAGAGVADDDDAHARAARQVRCCGSHGRRRRLLLLLLGARVLGDLGAAAAAAVWRGDTVLRRAYFIYSL